MVDNRRVSRITDKTHIPTQFRTGQEEMATSESLGCDIMKNKRQKTRCPIP
jgi:hypothetical protein